MALHPIHLSNRRGLADTLGQCCLLILLSFFAQSGSAQELDWYVRTDCPTYCNSNVMAAGPNDEVYFSGTFVDTLAFDSSVTTDKWAAWNSTDSYISRFDTLGNYYWTIQLASKSVVQVLGMDIDPSGNIVVVGELRDTTDFDPGPGSFMLASEDGQDGFIAKYDSSGTLLWAGTISGQSSQVPWDVETDAFGNIYTGGQFRNITDFDLFAGVYPDTALGSGDAFVAKYNSSGNVQWLLPLGTPGQFAADATTGIDLAPDGSIVVGGLYRDSTFNANPLGSPVMVPSANSADLFVARYDTSGHLIWVQTVTGPGYQASNKLFADSLGTIWIAGSFTDSTDFNPGTGVDLYGSAGNDDAFLLQLDTAGNYGWTQTISGPLSNFGLDVASGPNNGVVFSGQYRSTASFANTGPETVLQTGTNATNFLARYNANGDYIWARGLAPFYWEGWGDVISDQSGGIYLSGTAYNSSDLDFSQNTVPVDTGGYFARYRPCNFPQKTDTVTICSGQSVSLGGIPQSESGVYRFPIEAVAGCDTIATIKLIVVPDTFVYDTVQLCPGDSTFAAGSWQIAPGNYADTGTYASGCDSIHITTVEMLPNYADTTSVQICPGDSAMILGNWQTAPGFYIDSMQTALGCDSIIVTELVLLQQGALSLSITLCPGDSIYTGTSWKSVAGTYQDTLVGANSCDSVVTTALSLYPIASSSDSLAICTGDSFFVAGSWQATAGLYTDSLTDANGCDSLVYLTLSLLPTSNDTIQFTICAGDSVLIDGNWQTASGFYTTNFLNALGCDSTVVTDLTVLPNSSFVTGSTVCQGDSVWVFNAFETQAGTYLDTISSSNGCDSVLMHTLIVLPVASGVDSVDVCLGDSVFVGGAWHFTNGIYHDTLTAANGCDSIVEIDVEFHIQPVITDSTSLCDGDSLFVAGAWQTQPGTYVDVLPGLPCDTLLNQVLIFHPVQSDSVDIAACEGDSIFVGGDWQTTAGSYHDTLQSQMGCDSVVATNLSFGTPGFAGIGTGDTICHYSSILSLFSLLQGDPDTGGVWLDDNNTGALYGDSVSGFDAPFGASTFTYVVRGDSACTPDSATVVLVVEYCMSVPELDQKSTFRAFPNPASNIVNVAMIGDTRFKNYRLLALVGTAVQSGNLTLQGDGQTAQIDISSIASGTYLLELSNGASRAFVRIVVTGL